MKIKIFSLLTFHSLDSSQDWFFLWLEPGFNKRFWRFSVDCLLEPTNSVFTGYWILQKHLPFEYWGKLQNLRKFHMEKFKNSSRKRTSKQRWSLPYQQKYDLLPSIQTNLKAFWGKKQSGERLKCKDEKAELYFVPVLLPNIIIDDLIFTQRAFSTLVDCTS